MKVRNNLNIMRGIDMNKSGVSDVAAGTMVNTEITDISVEIRLSNQPGPVRAYGDVVIQTTNGKLRIHGYAIVQSGGGTLFVSRPGNIFFTVIDVERGIRKKIFDDILHLYRMVS
jgi:hypothetical protein